MPVEHKLYSELGAELVNRHYQEIGCNKWNTRNVLLLCGKIGCTTTVMAAMMRIAHHSFQVRCREETWTLQDGLILTMLERQVDLERGGIAADKPVFKTQ